jgi:hypothetical protein
MQGFISAKINWLPIPIIPLAGIALPGFASRHVAEWFHRRTETLCYQSQLFTLQRVRRIIYIKWRFSSLPKCIVNTSRFPPAIVVKEKTSFFLTTPFSHNTPRSNFIEER